MEYALDCGALGAGPFGKKHVIEKLAMGPAEWWVRSLLSGVVAGTRA